MESENGKRTGVLSGRVAYDLCYWLFTHVLCLNNHGNAAELSALFTRQKRYHSDLWHRCAEYARLLLFFLWNSTISILGRHRHLTLPFLLLLFVCLLNITEGTLYFAILGILIRPDITVMIDWALKINYLSVFWNRLRPRALLWNQQTTGSNCARQLTSHIERRPTTIETRVAYDTPCLDVSLVEFMHLVLIACQVELS